MKWSLAEILILTIFMIIMLLAFFAGDLNSGI
jgi:hypothetical protein